MKRKLSVLLAALLCTLSLASCGAPPAGISESAESSGKTPGSSSSGTVDKDALRVCVDLEYRAGYTEGKTPENAFYNLMNTVKSLVGPENVAKELKDTSVVMTKFDIGDGMQGMIGVVGPTRMDYAKVTARLSYFAESLSKLFSAPEPQKQLPESSGEQKSDKEA